MARDILPDRARALPEVRLAELEVKFANIERDQMRKSLNAKAEISVKQTIISHYMNRGIDGIWGRFINVLNGTLSKGYIAGSLTSPMVQVDVSVISGKVTKTFKCNVTANPSEVGFDSNLVIEDGDIIQISSSSEAINTLSLTLVVES